MNKEKLDSYLDLINASGSYIDFLNDEKDNPDDLFAYYPKELYVKLLISYSAAIFGVLKEHILVKNDNRYDIKILNNAFDEMLSDIKINGLYDNDISFEDKLDIFTMIRNKLLHGDFCLDEDKLIINSGEIKGTIDYKKLVELVRSLMYFIVRYSKGNGNFRMVTFKENGREMDNLRNLKYFFSDGFAYEFNYRMKDGFEVASSTIKVLDLFRFCFTDYLPIMKRHTLPNVIDILMRKFKPEFDKEHIEMTYKKKALINTEEYYKTREFFVNNPDILKMSLEERKKLIVDFVTQLLEESSFGYDNYIWGLYNNLLYISYLLDENRSELDLSKLSLTWLDDMNISAMFVHFYSLYQYGLEDVLSKMNKTNLIDLFNDSIFQFDKLDLSSLDDPNMVIELDFSNYHKCYDELLKLRTYKQHLVESAHMRYKNYMEKAKVKTKEKEQEFLDNISKVTAELDTLEKFYNSFNDFMNNNFSKYVRNFNILLHIRNALSHGNIKISIYISGDSLLDREIIIEDIYEGKCTYKVVIRYEDFLNFILNSQELVHEFLGKQSAYMILKERISKRKSEQAKKLIHDKKN